MAGNLQSGNVLGIGVFIAVKQVVAAVIELRCRDECSSHARHIFRNFKSIGCRNHVLALHGIAALSLVFLHGNIIVASVIGSSTEDIFRTGLTSHARYMSIAVDCGPTLYAGPCNVYCVVMIELERGLVLAYIHVGCRVNGTMMLNIRSRGHKCIVQYCTAQIDLYTCKLNRHT